MYESNWGKEHTHAAAGWMDTYTLKNVRIKVKCISVIVQSTRVHTLHAVKGRQLFPIYCDTSTALVANRTLK